MTGRPGSTAIVVVWLAILTAIVVGRSDRPASPAADLVAAEPPGASRVEDLERRLAELERRLAPSLPPAPPGPIQPGSGPPPRLAPSGPPAADPGPGVPRDGPPDGPPAVRPAEPASPLDPLPPYLDQIGVGGEGRDRLRSWLAAARQRADGDDTPGSRRRTIESLREEARVELSGLLSRDQIENVVRDLDSLLSPAR